MYSGVNCDMIGMGSTTSDGGVSILLSLIAEALLTRKKVRLLKAYSSPSRLLVRHQATSKHMRAILGTWLNHPRRLRKPTQHPHISNPGSKHTTTIDLEVTSRSANHIFAISYLMQYTLVDQVCNELCSCNRDRLVIALIRPLELSYNSVT